MSLSTHAAVSRAMLVLTVRSAVTKSHGYSFILCRPVSRKSSKLNLLVVERTSESKHAKDALDAVNLRDNIRDSNIRQLAKFTTTRHLLEDSKVDQQLEILKEEKEQKVKQVKNEVAKPDQSKIPVTPATQDPLLTRAWARIRKELKHYYTGFRLFFLETWISAKLLRKISLGDPLTRRERKQLLRTVADIFRLVPFLIFIIIPFMEFLLPVALKIFPGMLPSTFEEKSKKEVMAKQRFKLKLDMAHFLQDTVEQMAVRSGSKRTGETAQRFAEFMAKVRTGDLEVSNDEILKFSKAFRDSLTMDSLGRQQLTAICKILQIRPIGNTDILRFQIKLRMRKIRADDLLIKDEGNMNSLEVSDLQNLVRERGMRAYGVSKEKLVSQLEEWLELHLNDKVPLSLLLLSRTLYIPVKDATATEQLKATISALPSATSENVKLRLEELESGSFDNEARLEKVRREQAAIESEKVEREKSLQEAKDQAMKAKKKEEERVLDSSLFDVPPGYDTVTGTVERQPKVSPSSEKKSAPSVQPTPDVIKVVEEALTDLAESKTKVSEERDDLNELVKDIDEYNESLTETLAASEHKVKVNRGSRLLSRYLQYSVKRMQPTLDNIEAKRAEVTSKIDELSQAKKEALDDETVSAIQKKIDSHEGTVATMDEVKQAMMALQGHGVQWEDDDEMMAEISKIIDPDSDGIVQVDTVVKAIEFLSFSSGGGELTPEALKELIDVLSKEVDLKNRQLSATETTQEPEKKVAQM